MEGFLSVVATALSLGMGLSPLKTIREIQSQGHTGNLSIIPFFAILLNSVLACAYGVLIANTTIILVNGINGLLSFYYCQVFYNVAHDKASARFILLCGLSGFLVIMYRVFWVLDSEGDSPKQELGNFLMAATIFMFASPLSTVVTVIRTRNAASIPVMLSLASFACSLAWFLFGWTLMDRVIMIPNFLGMVLSASQLALVWFFGQKKGPILPK
mmetsp:Transcript_3869/g.5406  ORF Transcript_3869/g.5406 Transcript_3869/m.5406 type:complete len:214 (-) Transcript_3869:5-646(-)